MSGCLIKTGVEKNEQHLNMDYNFDHQMSLSKSKMLVFKQLFTVFKMRCSIRGCQSCLQMAPRHSA